MMLIVRRMSLISGVLSGLVLFAGSTSSIAAASLFTPPELTREMNRFLQKATALIRSGNFAAYQQLFDASATPGCTFMAWSGKMIPIKQEQAYQEAHYQRIASVTQYVYKLVSTKPTRSGYAATSVTSLSGIAQKQLNKRTPFRETTLQERLWVKSGASWKIGNVALLKFSETSNGVTETVATNHRPVY